MPNQQILQKKPKLGYRVAVYSRHPSHAILREQLGRNNFRVALRLGSTTELEDTVAKGGKRIEINTTQAVRNSASKFLMKKCFNQAGVKTAEWFTTSAGIMFDKDGIAERENAISVNDLPYPIIAKSHYGSRGNGNYKLDTAEALNEWKVGRNLNNYIFEKFTPYKLEFRLHISCATGLFYTCRKALKPDAPAEKRWMMNDETCIWYMDTNEKFYKPNSWDAIVEECKKALIAIGLDTCAFDVRVQGALDNRDRPREFQDFFIVEGNSAPSMAEVTSQKYLQEIPIIATKKAKEAGLIN